MAGRPRTIDRDKVLDAAEEIVMAQGASGLTFDALAKAAGITKGGLQYCFGTKENLIRAMISRWSEVFEGEVTALAGPDPAPEALIRAHLRVTEVDEIADHSRSAAMMTALLERPDQVASSRDWYAGRLAGLDLSRPEDRRTAVAFLAGEGAFLLKTLGLVRFSAQEWTALFADMQKLTQGE
ncbi:TetR/AcrR family transcriptional regulator [Haematobacter genomosp. 1]|uniref:TetR family transcriptional regulator n=1 Tax=Haematobacter genomosp. 1 TaxID=366618 RepID=A0A212A880_9RHOB|nr:TetR/AcrR family transcriptional regulator [Haematobacter genomosp. 1]OWJ75707.1 TetR family transcriptional regulator [Haematobacter genomosp. 1]